MARLPVTRLLCAATLLATLVAPQTFSRDAAWAEEDPGPLRIPLPHPVPDETNFFGLYDGRTKVGQGLLGLELVSEEGRPVYRSRSAFEAHVPGIDVRFESLDLFRGEAPFELLHAREVRRDGAGMRTVEVWADAPARAEVVEDGLLRRVELAPVDYTLADRLTQIHWVRRRPAVGDAVTVRELDLSDLLPDRFTYRVTGIGTRPTVGVTVTVYELAMRSARRGALGTALVDAEGRLLEMTFAGRPTMRLEPEAQAREPGFASPLFGFGRVPVNEGLGPPRTIRRLVVALYGREARLVPSGARQTVWHDEESDDILLAVGTGAGGDVPAGEAERLAATAADEEHPRDDPEVVACAQGAAGGVVGTRAQVERLVAFVADFVEDANVPAETPVVELLSSRKGDGTEHARLFTTLARALDVPAREVVGLVYLGDAEMAFAPHVWNEVVVDGRWVEVDATWNEGVPSATHVTLARGTADWVAAAAPIRGLQAERREVGRDAPDDTDSQPGR